MRRGELSRDRRYIVDGLRVVQVLSSLIIHEGIMHLRGKRFRSRLGGNPFIWFVS